MCKNLAKVINKEVTDARTFSFIANAYKNITAAVNQLIPIITQHFIDNLSILLKVSGN
jgi:hypothetical protein